MASSASLSIRGGRGGGAPGIGAAIDRWIYVFMASWFLVVTLVGFVPDSIGLVAATRAGTRPPLPVILHVHAVLMGGLLLLLLAQTVLMATGMTDRHRLLGRVMMVLAPTIFIVWVILVPTIYHEYWHAAQSRTASVPVRTLARALDDILLGQLRVGILFPLFVFVGLRARSTDPGLHKRMMILAIATILPPALARMWWLPKPLPGLMSFDLYILLIVSPMFIWDLVRKARIPTAYVIWAGCYALVSIPAYLLTGSRWWHGVAARLMGV